VEGETSGDGVTTAGPETANGDLTPSPERPATAGLEAANGTDETEGWKVGTAEPEATNGPTTLLDGPFETEDSAGADNEDPDTTADSFRRSRRILSQRCR